MSVDARCAVCGSYLTAYLTESGDDLVVEPCKKGCTNKDPKKFETDEDFSEE